jgi:hypothetical protein
VSGAFSLQRQLLAQLGRGSAELASLAARLGRPLVEVEQALTRLAHAGLVDALDPPPPCDRRQMRWFLTRRARAA